ncbi:NUDIX hydrolase N-terminal domain-containing protein [Acetohalobium arabaticum]|uniref:NUDIX hydrolase n=1 Tax=Acetohalobium arabaticum (strain ATCC 49924 / DSM 5501 / Z-7288) TaxID=574087 RepID=D9QQG0_ACEAZ|nr:NUDIX hydrolase [Acetohalobium arabaticum]ADL12751.1 NUDIX hydrolase [Acetohalobium arabaticum DSM 5501]
MSKEPKWLEYAKRLQAIAQAGLTYSENKYDRERFEEIREISSSIIKDQTELKKEEISELFMEDAGYPTPKIDVRAAVFKDDKILLVKEKVDGRWSLPGGWADVGYSLKENLIKEAQEEAGVKIKPQRIISILDRRKHHKKSFPFGMYKIFVECEFLSGEFEKNIETSDSGFFSVTDLPPLSLGRNTKEQIRSCFEARRKDYHKAIFD